ncbi:hypothetical protein CDL15_Pgr014496 [Punica granatum]|uniref:Uncharacterized protein n=1 Tax=Punica granatum TaxID=22663 RepID=A0A218WE61_PUNGR|nr:hypothetical protein CDL15_Pgr014496 [Punica granatum]
MLYGIRAAEARLLIRRLFQGYSKGETKSQKQDMKSVFFELTLNVVMRMIAGKRYYGKSVEEEEEARKFKEIVSETFRLSGPTDLVNFIPALKWTGLTCGIEKSFIELHEKRDKFMKNLIEEHKNRIQDSPSSVGTSRTMIEVLLSPRETEPEYYRN